MTDVDDAIEIGAHLLGRKPFVADVQDFELRHWIENDSALEAALAQLQASHAAASTKAWAAVATKAIEALQPGPPAPPDPPPAPPEPPAPPAPGPAPNAAVHWSDPDPTLNQANFGTCVGNGTAQFLNTDPVEDHFTEGMGQPATTGLATARALYFEATVLDGQPDDPNAPGGGQQGASVRSGMKALANRKRIGSYAAAASTDEITAWLRTKGSLVAGTDWLEEMFTPDAHGVLHVAGAVAGGHCYLLDEHVPAGAENAAGLVLAFEAYGMRNSWDDSWGIHGRAYIAVSDFATLLAQGGEAWAAVELSL